MEIPNYLLINKKKTSTNQTGKFLNNKREKEICKSIIKKISIPQVVLKSIRVVDNNMGLVISF